MNTSKFDNKTKSHNFATITECLQEDKLNKTMFTSKLTHHTIDNAKNNKFRQDATSLQKCNRTHTNSQSRQSLPKAF